MPNKSVVQKEIILDISSRPQLREWYEKHAAEGVVFMLHVSRKRNADTGVLSYLDAVEEALCFGYIDSTNRKIEGVTYCRFSPRRANSHWTELNLARCRRLERLGLMTPLGLRVIPTTQEQIGEWITAEFSRHAEAYSRFLLMPPLYRRIKLSNIHFTDRHLRDHAKALLQLNRLIDASLEGKLLGQWNDDGRLTE